MEYKVTTQEGKHVITINVKECNTVKRTVDKIKILIDQSGGKVVDYTIDEIFVSRIPNASKLLDLVDKYNKGIHIIV